MKTSFALFCGLVLAWGGQARELTCTSPDGRIAVGFSAEADGMRWSLKRDGKALVAPSRLGLVFSGFTPKGSAELGEMRIVDSRTRSADTSWTTTLYRRGTVRDRFNELTVTLEEVAAPHRRLGYVFRAYDEGAAFRYVIPEQEGVDGLEILRELTEWRFPGACEGWFTTYARAANSQEATFRRRPLADIPASDFVGMPATVEVAGQKVALCEAALVNWAGLYYRTPAGGQPSGASALEAYLTPLPNSSAATAGSAVICTLPAESPWRVAICGDDELDLLQKNDIVVNLNPPPEEGLDFSWVKPGASSWDWWLDSNNGLTTERTLKLVDFAAEMGWPYHTIDGGWYGFARRPNHGPNVKLAPRPGFDLAKIVAHAKEKGVGIWVWIHWQEIEDTGVEETFALLERWGVKGVKTDFLDRHDQWIVNWYEKACRAAARHHVMINFHGAFKPTGTERTWPNNLTREGICGNEMSKFNGQITPEHCATLPFTRYLLGPGDFTPGSFGNVFAKDFVPQVKRGHRYGDETDLRPIWAETVGTRAASLAQCIAFDSPLMTLCDGPERYRGAAGIEALRALPTTWKATIPLAGKCGEFYSVVRETHDGRFYFAALTAKRRNIDLKLDFLGEGAWKMHVFADDSELTCVDAKEVALGSRMVRKGEKISFGLLNEGGAVAIFERVEK